MSFAVRVAQEEEIERAFRQKACFMPWLPHEKIIVSQFPAESFHAHFMLIIRDSMQDMSSFRDKPSSSIRAKKDISDFVDPKWNIIKSFAERNKVRKSPACWSERDVIFIQFLSGISLFQSNL